MSHLILPAALAVLTGCGSDPNSENEQDISGSYSMVSMVLTSIDDPGIKVELLQLAGIGVALILTADGSLTLITHQSGQPISTEQGTITVSGNSLTLTADGQTIPGTWSKANKTLIINLSSGLFAFDFDGDGVEEAATVRWTLKEV